MDMKLAYFIDTSASYQEMIRQQMLQLGFEVRSFISVNDYLRATEKKPDLILLSQQLKNNEKGIDYLRQVQHKNKNVPVVMLSNEGDVYTGSEALKMGVMDYIEKNGAVLVRLRTAIDNIPAFIKREKRKKLLRWLVLLVVIALIGLALLMSGTI